MLDLSFLVDSHLLFKVYVVSVFCYCLFGAMLIQNDQDTTYGRKPLPWASNPKRWIAGTIFVALMPGVNTVMALCIFCTMLFNYKRDKRLYDQYCSKWGKLS